MRLFTKNELDTFERLAQLPQASLLKTMAAYMKNRYKKVTVTDQYICAHGNIPIALVAHMDTVFAAPPIDIYYDTNKNVLWSPDGLGADDRAGLFAILQILKTGLRPHIILTTDEEKGAIGASALVQSGKCPFEDLRFVIQLDRRGSDDCVFYDCDNPEFTRYIEDFGFVENWGSFSDISVLCPAWGIAGVNLSVGYYDEHSISETLHAGALFSTIKKVVKILSTPTENIPAFKYIKRAYTYTRIQYPTNSTTSNVFGVQCDGCRQYFEEVEMFSVYEGGGKYTSYCADCLVNMGDWCAKCGDPFISTNPRERYCVRCAGVDSL